MPKVRGETPCQQSGGSTMQTVRGEPVRAMPQHAPTKAHSQATQTDLVHLDDTILPKHTDANSFPNTTAGTHNYATQNGIPCSRTSTRKDENAATPLVCEGIPEVNDAKSVQSGGIRQGSTVSLRA